MAPCARRVASLRLAGESTCDLMMFKTLLAIELAFPRYDVYFIVIVPIRYFALGGIYRDGVHHFVRNPPTLPHAVGLRARD